MEYTEFVIYVHIIVTMLPSSSPSGSLFHSFGMCLDIDGGGFENCSDGHSCTCTVCTLCFYSEHKPQKGSLVPQYKSKMSIKLTLTIVECKWLIRT